MIKLDLVPVKSHYGRKREPYQFPWKSCAPFVDNKIAKLIHRPREVCTYTHHKAPYLAVHTWCGNAFNGENKFTFHDTPPTNKLLCERCEMMAVQNGLPSSDELAGKHVHKGRLVAVQTCDHPTNNTGIVNP